MLRRIRLPGRITQSVFVKEIHKKGETTMRLDSTGKKCTTRRGFFRKIIAGAGSLALASWLRGVLTPNKIGLMAAPKVTQSPDGTKYGGYF